MNDPEQASMLLNQRQRSLAAAAITVLSTIVILAFVLGIFWLLKQFVGAFQDVLLPLVTAMILAALFRPIVIAMQSRTRMNRSGSIATMIAILVLIMLAVSTWLVPVLFNQAGEFIGQTISMAESQADRAIRHVESNRSEYEDRLFSIIDEEDWKQLKSQLSGYVEKALSVAIKGASASINAVIAAGSGLASLAGSFAMWAVMPIYLIFLLTTDAKILPQLKKQLCFLPSNIRDDSLFLIKEFSDILLAYFRGQVTIAFLTGVMLAVGFSLIGLKAGLLIGFVAGLANLIPYLGTTLGILTILPYAYAVDEGGWPQLALAAIVFALAQFIQDYVLTPKIMGERTGLGPMTIIFATFFWGVALGGILGVILAVPLTAFFMSFWRLAKSKYLPRLTDEQEKQANPEGAA